MQAALRPAAMCSSSGGLEGALLFLGICLDSVMIWHVLKSESLKMVDTCSYFSILNGNAEGWCAGALHLPLAGG